MIFPLIGKKASVRTSHSDEGPHPCGGDFQIAALERY